MNRMISHIWFWERDTGEALYHWPSADGFPAFEISSHSTAENNHLLLYKRESRHWISGSKPFRVVSVLNAHPVSSTISLKKKTKI